MRKLLVLTLVLGLVGVAAARDLGNAVPAKAPAVGVNVVNPQLVGGDNFGSATPIPGLPYNDSGNTTGYMDDYDEVCPYTGASPDVVYSYVAPAGSTLYIDLCGSSYDTKVFVYDAAYSLIGCNDDFYFDEVCGVYVSKIENMACSGLIYIVVDGYGTGSFGPYLIEVGNFTPCDLVCAGYPENEPPLIDGYVDGWNGGCNSPPSYPWQTLTADALGNLTLCGVSGWYLSGTGSQYRDTDWYYVTAGTGGFITVLADAESPTYVFELAGDCVAGISVVQNVIVGACAPGTLNITAVPNSIKMVWFGPTVFAPPQGGTTASYEYIGWFSGLAPGIIATEATTWGTMKALYE